MAFPEWKYSPVKVFKITNKNQKAVGIQLFWIVLLLFTIHSSIENATIEVSLAVGRADVSAAIAWWFKPKGV